MDLTLFKAFSYPTDIYLFCYDASFIATAPTSMAMSQGNHMDLMTFLSSSDYVQYIEKLLTRLHEKLSSKFYLFLHEVEISY